MSDYTELCPECGSAVSMKADVNEETAAVIDDLHERGLLAVCVDIAKTHHVLMREVAGRARYKRVANARHACWLYLRNLGFSYPDIGRIWRVDHTSVMSGCRAPEERRNKRSKS